MTVNQMVAGSSPAGGAEGLEIIQGLFLFFEMPLFVRASRFAIGRVAGSSPAGGAEGLEIIKGLFFEPSLISIFFYFPGIQKVLKKTST